MDGVLFDTERFGRKAWDAAGDHFGIEGLGEQQQTVVPFKL